MKRGPLLLAVLTLLLVGVGAKAGVITGPTFTSTNSTVGGSDNAWGIEFTALHNSTLTGFDYTHRTADFGNAFTGTITLVDVTKSNTTVYSTPYGSLPANGNPALSVLALTGLNIPLHAGDVYRLFATSDIVSNANDEVYQYSSSVYGLGTFTFPESDADISVTKGYFGDPGPGSFQVNNAWGAFTNLSDSPAPVPEPVSLALWGLGALGGAGYVWRRRKAAGA